MLLRTRIPGHEPIEHRIIRERQDQVTVAYIFVGDRRLLTLFRVKAVPGDLNTHIRDRQLEERWFG
jgi:hypothetical protein